MTNPIFRKPALYLKLPSLGKYYPDNSVDMPPNNELPVFATTGLDEISIKTVDGLFNGSAIPEIIKSCVPGIKDPWSMPVIDLDTVLVAIKLASFGNVMDIETLCPKCNETSKYGLNLTGILSNLKPGNYDIEENIDDLYVKYKPLCYKEHNIFNIQEFEFQKILNNFDALPESDAKTKKSKEIMYATLEMRIERIVASIEYIRTNDFKVVEKSYIKEFLFQCSNHYFEKIKNKYTSLKESSQTKPINIKCVSCEHAYEQPLILNYCEYFRSRLLYMDHEGIQNWLDAMEKEINDIRANALKMAWYMRGGITYSDILLLTDKEREAINTIIEDNLETTKKTQLPFF